jgi:PAS domain S-box-containing protein
VDIINAKDHLMYESIHIRKDQTQFPCMTDVTLVRDPEGLPLYRFGYFQDITSQKLAEEDIRSVVTHARCILWRAIVEGNEGWEILEPGANKFKWKLTVQDEMAAQHFLPLDVPPGQSYTDAWLASRHPDDMRRAEEEASQAFIDGDGSFSHQFRCVDKFGRIMWVREEVGIVRLNDQLRQQAELLELSHDAIIVRDEEGEILYWNSGAEHLYGWDRKEAVGRNIHDLLGTQTPPGEFAQALDEHGFWAGTLLHTARDGRQITVDSRHLLVQRTDGIKVVLETNHDLSSRMDGAEEIASY